ncbi:MAG: GNAT family N-acetyltransferase [Halomonadaceae bacterium]|nr:MAG: GNAT family N-acetyltransferase [Halomonadaceae bacterium]
MSELTLLPCQPYHWPAVWALLEPVFRAGETYAVDPGITEAAARKMWLEAPVATWLAWRGDQLLGTYYLKPNQAGPGSHVCNCGYVVSPSARGQGLAGNLCQHSQEQALALGFRAMQYNLVVATNTAAIRVWQREGFAVVGCLPEAFRHPSEGLVDGLVMFKTLQP